MEIEGLKAIVVGGSVRLRTRDGRAHRSGRRQPWRSSTARSRPAPRSPTSSAARGTRRTCSTSRGSAGDRRGRRGPRWAARRREHRGWREGGRTLGRSGPFDLDDFRAVIDLNLIGTFNTNRLWPPTWPTGTERRRRTRRVDQHGVDRRVRGPDRPGRLHRSQGRHRRHVPHHGPRPRQHSASG